MKHRWEFKTASNRQLPSLLLYFGSQKVRGLAIAAMPHPVSAVHEAPLGI